MSSNSYRHYLLLLIGDRRYLDTLMFGMFIEETVERVGQNLDRQEQRSRSNIEGLEGQ